MLAKARRLSASELLALSDRQFVEECYRQILLREPDTDGVIHYLTRLGLGDDRLGIASAIASSDEARTKARSQRSLALDILRLHAERLMLDAWTPARRRSATSKIHRYMAILAGRSEPLGGTPTSSDPFAAYLKNVIEGSNS